MTKCDEPRCSFNRQGVRHETHESIQESHVKDPCLDGRCAMNRLGILHESHNRQTNYKEEKFENKEPFITNTKYDKYFKILEIPNNSTLVQIKDAYRKLVKQWHPDRNPRQSKYAEKMFVTVNQAYEKIAASQCHFN